MDAIKLPIADENSKDITAGVVTFPKKQLANLSYRGRPKIAVEALGCLSLLDQGEQHGRACALPSPDVRYKNWMANTKVKTQPIINVQRPRAILSSPENDELICELQQQAEEKLNIATPKASLSAPEVLISAGVRTDFVAESSISSTDSNQEGSDVSPSPKYSLGLANIRVIRPKVTKGKPTGQCTMLEPKTVSARSGNDENLLTPNGRNRVGKKQVCSPSVPPSIGLKVTHKPMTKGDSGRVVRPWY